MTDTEDVEPISEWEVFIAEDGEKAIRMTPEAALAAARQHIDSQRAEIDGYKRELDATTEKLAEAEQERDYARRDMRDAEVRLDASRKINEVVTSRLAAAQAALRRIADGAGNRGDYAIQIAEAYFAAPPTQEADHRHDTPLGVALDCPICFPFLAPTQEAEASPHAAIIIDAIVSQWWGEGWKTEQPDAPDYLRVRVSDNFAEGEGESVAEFVGRIMESLAPTQEAEG